MVTYYSPIFLLPLLVTVGGYCSDDLLSRRIQHTVLGALHEQNSTRLLLKQSLTALSDSKDFLEDAWGVKPVCLSLPSVLAGLYSLKELQTVVEDGMEWARSLVKNPIFKAHESEEDGDSEDEGTAPSSWSLLTRHLQDSTVVFNSIANEVPPLAKMRADFQAAFELPANVNLYCTAPGQAASVAPHNGTYQWHSNTIVIM